MGKEEKILYLILVSQQLLFSLSEALYQIHLILTMDKYTLIQ